MRVREVEVLRWFCSGAVVCALLGIHQKRTSWPHPDLAMICFPLPLTTRLCT